MRKLALLVDKLTEDTVVRLCRKYKGQFKWMFHVYQRLANMCFGAPRKQSEIAMLMHVWERECTLRLIFIKLFPKHR